MPGGNLPALSAPHILEYPYTRSTGSVIGRFFAALAEHRIVGIRAADGRVLVPPQEYDPHTGAPLDEFVDVHTAGEVVTWSWVAAPRPGDPLDRAFAWVLVRLDGADTALLHALDAASERDVRTGMRVRIRWRPEARGDIHDIECFEPDAGPSPGVASRPEEPSATSGAEPYGVMPAPTRLDYTYIAGVAQTRFLYALADGNLLGQRCPRCKKVYIPPRGSCPTCGVPTEEDVQVSDRGMVTTFCIVNIPFPGMAVKPPFAAASVLLDGADIAIFHLLHEVDVADVRMGMRVEAVWKPRDQWDMSLENITHFRPTGEPDAPYEAYKDHL
jgi:uncharacterized OB-fold protein